jgi:hypothetical protein
LLHPRREGDTAAVVQGARAARSCIADGHFLGCSGVFEFPLFQYLPAAALGAVGVSDAGILRVLAALSTVSFAAILLLAWRIVSRRADAGSAALVVAVLVAGPLLWYARSSFGEMLAAFLILLFVEAVLSRRSTAAVAGTFWLAGITKETALPFLLVLGAVALFGFGRETRLSVVRAQLTGAAVGTALVIVTTFGFNLFRFDSIRNKTNLQDLFRVPGLGRRSELAAGIWAAPNGGIIPFWPLAVLLGAAALLWGLRRGVAAGTARWPAAALVVVAAILTAGFASWYSPFGWNAWGPRLMLPWLPVLLVLATVLYPRPARALAEWIGATTARTALTGVIVALAALPHLAALRSPDPLNRLFAPDRTCPVPLIVQQVPRDYFYHCINHLAWAKTPVWIDSLRALGNGTGVAFTLLLILACVASLLLAPFRELNPSR